MKQYILQPAYKKSVIEWTTWSKEINGVKHMLQREVGWRWGAFVINVPETEAEVLAFMDDKGYGDVDLDIMLDDYGVTTLEEMCLPDPEEESVELEDYDHEMIETWDGCWDDWSVNCYAGEGLDEDSRYELAEAMQEIYEEGYEEAIEEDGWEFIDSGFAISGEFKLEEVPEGVSAYEFYSDNN